MTSGPAGIDLLPKPPRSLPSPGFALEVVDGVVAYRLHWDANPLRPKRHPRGKFRFGAPRNGTEYAVTYGNVAEHGAFAEVYGDTQLISELEVTRRLSALVATRPVKRSDAGAVPCPRTGDNCYALRMLRGEDIVLLLKLVDADPSWTVRQLADETTIPRSVVHRAIKRLGAAGLYSERARSVNIPQAEEFLIHGLRYIFPARLEGPSLGVPTAWAAPPLKGRIVTSRDELPPVWPDALAGQRGLAVRPLHPSAVEAVRRDPALGERLALLDALRLGGPRIKSEAAELLVPRLLPPSREHRAA